MICASQLLCGINSASRGACQLHFIYTHTYIYKHKHTCTYIYIAFLGACQLHFMCLYTCIHIYVYIYTHTYIYTDIYIYIYSFSRSVSNIFHCKTSAQIDSLNLSKASARVGILSLFYLSIPFKGVTLVGFLFGIKKCMFVPLKVVPCVGCKRRKACP